MLVLVPTAQPAAASQEITLVACPVSMRRPPYPPASSTLSVKLRDGSTGTVQCPGGAPIIDLAAFWGCDSAKTDKTE